MRYVSFLAMVGIYASAETLDGVEDLATYTVPDSTKYGQSWYIDAEGEYKLFDGVIPDTNTLDAARDEAMKEDPISKTGMPGTVGLRWPDRLQAMPMS